MVSTSLWCPATLTYLVRTVGNTNPRPALDTCKQPQRSKGGSNISLMTSPYNDPIYKANRKQILSDGKATICALCGKAGANTADHIISLMHGGDNSIDNLQPAHQRCNSIKGATEQARKNAKTSEKRPKTDFQLPAQRTFQRHSLCRVWKAATAGLPRSDGIARIAFACRHIHCIY